MADLPLNPMQIPLKGAGTTLWIYTGKEDPFTDPFTDKDWTRLAKIKDITPGELTAEATEDTYLDDDDADWKSTKQGEKTAGDTSMTLAWKPGETGQQELIQWFHKGDELTYKIKYKNGAVDVFRGWISSIGKAIPAKEDITRTIKITNNGKPLLAEERAVRVNSITLAAPTGGVAVGQTKEMSVTFSPSDASDRTISVTSSAEDCASVTCDGDKVIITGLKAGTTNVTVTTSDGAKTATQNVTVAASAQA